MAATHFDPRRLESEERCYTTLLELVAALGSLGLDESRVVEVATELVDSGRVVLTGNFRGRRFREMPRQEPVYTC